MKYICIRIVSNYQYTNLKRPSKTKYNKKPDTKSGLNTISLLTSSHYNYITWNNFILQGI